MSRLVGVKRMLVRHSGILRRRALDRQRRRLDRAPDRRVLEDVILPALGDDDAIGVVLFVGCDWYTVDYPDLVPGVEYWTIDLDSEKARYGAAWGRHLVADIRDLGRHVAPGYFDAVICNGVLGYGLTSRQAADEAFTACRDALKAGGLLVLGWGEDLPGVADCRPETLVSLADGFERVVFGPFADYRVTLPEPCRHLFDFYRRKKS